MAAVTRGSEPAAACFAWFNAACSAASFRVSSSRRLRYSVIRDAFGSITAPGREVEVGILLFDPFPERAIAATITVARPAITQVCVFLGKMPGGFIVWLRTDPSGTGACSGSRIGSDIAVTSLLGGFRADEREPLFANGQIPVIEDLGDDIRSIAKFKLDKIGFSVLQLVQGGRLLGMRLNVGKLAIGVHGGDVKWPLPCLDTVGELEAGRILGPELPSLALDRRLRGIFGIARLGLCDVNLLAIIFNLLGHHKSRLAVRGRQHRFILRLDE